jgi:hypothetical protein
MCVLTRLIHVAPPGDMRRLAAEDAVAESEQRIGGVERDVASTLRADLERFTLETALKTSEHIRSADRGMRTFCGQ